jgi:acetolactate decarboxylase
MKFNLGIIVVILLCLSLAFCTGKEKENHTVNVIGQMKDVMWKGELYGKISLDSLATNREDLYGLGPVEYLAGELLVFAGKSFKSTVTSESSMKVEETFDVKATFFAYSFISGWKSQSLPDSIQDIKQLEQFLSKLSTSSKEPFLFKISAKIDSAKIHVVSLPAGSKVSSPQDAHQGQVDYQLWDETVDLLGFFSTKHQSIFTHHDSFVHLHLITADRQRMGHLDEVSFRRGSVVLYLPEGVLE